MPYLLCLADYFKWMEHKIPCPAWTACRDPGSRQLFGRFVALPFCIWVCYGGLVSYDDLNLFANIVCHNCKLWSMFYIWL